MCRRHPFLEVLHHVEPVDGYGDALTKHLPRRLDIPVPHVRRHLLHRRQQAAFLTRLQIGRDRGFLTVFQDVQHPLVIVVDDYGDELSVSFFKDSSSIPIFRIVPAAVVAACRCRRSTYS